jgi:hypothetical protein
MKLNSLFCLHLGRKVAKYCAERKSCRKVRHAFYIQYAFYKSITAFGHNLTEGRERASIVTLCRRFVACGLLPLNTSCQYVAHFFSCVIVFQLLSRNFDAGYTLCTTFLEMNLLIRRWGDTCSIRPEDFFFDC